MRRLTARVGFSMPDGTVGVCEAVAAGPDADIQVPVESVQLAFQVRGNGQGPGPGRGCGRGPLGIRPVESASLRGRSTHYPRGSCPVANRLRPGSPSGTPTEAQTGTTMVSVPTRQSASATSSSTPESKPDPRYPLCSRGCTRVAEVDLWISNGGRHIRIGAVDPIQRPVDNPIHCQPKFYHPEQV